MIIEWLRIAMQPHLRERYRRIEQQVWTAALAQHQAFMGKEVWEDPDNPAELIVWIRWASRQEWKSISPGYLAELERVFSRQMGPGWRIIECREYRPVWQFTDQG